MSRAEEVLNTPNIERLTQELIAAWPRGGSMKNHAVRIRIVQDALTQAVKEYERSNISLSKTLCYFAAKLQEAETDLREAQLPCCSDCPQCGAAAPRKDAE